jgi:5-methylcytosine-specific restriction endonuclease McrA
VQQLLIMLFQVCNTCGIKKSLTREFFGHNTTKGVARWRKKCRECTNAYNRSYAQANPRSVTERAAKRQDQLKSWIPGNETKQRLYNEQNGLCALCGETLNAHWADSEECQVDHLIPVSQGGDNSESNLVIAHRKCNQEKAAKNLLEYISWREMVQLPRSSYRSAKTLECLQKLKRLP